MRFAESTSVSADSSRSEIERTLSRYGATGFMYGWQGNSAIIAFEMHDRRVKFVLPLPDKADPQFWKTPSRGTKRSPEAAYKEWEQATRQRWRALALAVKAKLEVVVSGIATFEDEFLAHIVLPDGSTIGQFMVPQIQGIYENKKMPKLLPGLTN